MPIWGCDSINRTDQPRTPAQYPRPAHVPVADNPTLYDYVTRRRGRNGPPQFWGRYINNYSLESEDARLEEILGTSYLIAIR